MNKYSIYGYQCEQQKSFSDEKYTTALNSVNDFQTAYDVIVSIAGSDIEGKHGIVAPNGLRIGIIKDDEKLEIAAWLNHKNILNRGWEIPKK